MWKIKKDPRNTLRMTCACWHTACVLPSGIPKYIIEYIDTKINNLQNNSRTAIRELI